jgi:hypothetical protein
MKYIYMTFVISLITNVIVAQQKSNNTKLPEFKKNLNEDGSNFIKLGMVAQFWGRYTDLNQGSTIDGFAQTTASDIGIRRLRFNAWGQLTDRVGFHVQFGQNNYSYLSKLYVGSFFHDAVGEYKVSSKGFLTFGGGLTGYSGLLRYAAPSVGSILSLDAPLYQQVTNGITDQFLRKLGVYAKGQYKGFDYRFILSKPNVASNSTVSLPSINPNRAVFALTPPSWQKQAYVQYSFFDKENNMLGYRTGSYLGTKKILNIGGGIIQQDKAMWILDTNADTAFTAMTLYGIDVFTEIPLSKKKNTISFYGAWSDYQLGRNFIRNLGVMNPANGNQGTTSFAGGGNALPLIGTGQTVYIQLGYKFKDQLFKENGTLQLYANTQLSKYDKLAETMNMYEAGINWLIHGTHGAKLTLGWQNRPIYNAVGVGSNISQEQTSRKDMWVLQYQISL